jgi:carbon storage regulator CsrA
MLVLTRKYQEKIKIGDNITITVLRMKGKAVRLGIEAPTNVPVIRGELSFTIDDAEGLDVEEAAKESVSDQGDSTIQGRKFGRATGREAQWTTTPRSKNDAAAEPATVGFVRVPRDKVASTVPKFVAGSAPLRSMMDQR